MLLYNVAVLNCLVPWVLGVSESTDCVKAVVDGASISGPYLQPPHLVVWITPPITTLTNFPVKVNLIKFAYIFVTYEKPYDERLRINAIGHITSCYIISRDFLGDNGQITLTITI